MLVSLFILFLPGISVQAADQTMPVQVETAPQLAPEHEHAAAVQAQEPPAPAGEPEGEMPPSAPPILRHSETGDAGASSSMFNLQAQRYVNGTQQDTGLMQPPLAGRYWQQAPLNSQARSDRLNTGAETGNSLSPRSLTQVELKRLADHEVVLLIDRSGSMSSMDCPTGNFGNTGRGLGMLTGLLGVPLLSTSRWNWCLQQTSEMARQTQSIYEKGITVVLFSSGYMAFPNVTMDRLPQIFSQNYPSGGTNLAEPLAVQIGEYFRRRAYAHGNLKPLMIGIIPDGCPNNRAAVVEALVEATHLMRDPQELTIIFFMIGGMDLMGERFVGDLSVNLLAKGAVYPIVKQVSFSELQQIGLAKAIAQKLQ